LPQRPYAPGQMRALLALLIVAAAATWFCWPSSEVAVPAQPPTPPTVQPPVQALPEAAALTPVEPARPDEPTIRMPDGTQVPLLNGVRQAAAPGWDPARPYAPIIGKQTLKGIEYYVHADGSTTTTIMAWRTDLKRLDGTTRVAHPQAAQTVVDDQNQPVRRN